MVDPPRLHQKLGAIWVEVTKTVLAVGRLQPSRSKQVSDFENAASNNPFSLSLIMTDSPGPLNHEAGVASFNKKGAAGVGQPFASSMDVR